MPPDPSAMMSMANDPVLGPKVLSLLSEELKSARLKIERLEKARDEATDGDINERAEAAERELQSTRKKLEDAIIENRLLVASLEETKDSKTPKVKKNKPIKMLVDKEVWTDDVVAEPDDEKAELQGRLEKYRAKYKSHKISNKDLAETCQNLEKEIVELRAENEQLVEKSTSKGQDIPPLQDDEKMELQGQLEKYRAKYKSHKTSNKELAETCQNLEKEIAELRTENEQLVEKSKSKGQDIPPLRTPLGNGPSWDDLHNFMKNLPRGPKFRRPAEEELRPICHRSVDLQSYLASETQTAKCSTNFLYLPDLLIWGPQMIDGIALGPLQTYDGNLIGNWKRRSIFEVLYDKTFSLFDQRDEYVFYLGTYKAICLLEQLQNGISITESDDTTANTKPQNQSFCNVKGGHRPKKDDPTSLSAVRGLYLDGTLRVEPLGLQNIGFNHQLYQDLIKRFQPVRTGLVIPNTTSSPVTRAPPPGPASATNRNGKRTADPVNERDSGERWDASHDQDSKRRRFSEGRPLPNGHESGRNQPKHLSRGSSHDSPGRMANAGGWHRYSSRSYSKR